MNLIYILGKGSVWDDNELRYSLRSVEKFLTGFDRVIIVGDRPVWIKNVEHFYTPDFRYIKSANAIAKIKAACEIPGNYEFILMNDDFYFTEPARVEDISLYKEKTLGWLLNRGFTGEYRGSLNRTKDYLEGYGYSAINFELHYPMPIVAGFMREILIGDDFSAGYHARSLYGNMAGLKLHNILEKKDIKLGKALDFAETIKEINGNGMFSISDEWLKAEGKFILRELYPAKSKYEI